MKSKSGSNRSGLFGAGNWIVDQVKMIDVFPQRARLANISSQSEGTGGAPYTGLVDLARLGAPFPLAGAGLVGKDLFGNRILEECQRLKIDTKYLRSTNEAPTSFTDVMTEAKGGVRTFFHCRGANALWDGKEIDFTKTKAKIFHLGYLLLLDAMDKEDKKFGTKAAGLLAAAQAAGLKTSVDTVSEDSDRFTRVVTPALKFVDYCILNEIEDTVSLRHAAGALLQCGVKELVVIHFPEGAFARTRDGKDSWQPSLNLPQKYIAGSAGAGDGFCAGVLYGLHEGWDLQRCLLTGVCVAAASLSHPTCTQGVGTLDAAMALAKKYRPRPPLEPEY